MSVDMLTRILDKSVNEARVLSVQLYHYNEPTLIPHMHRMIEECHKRGLPVFLSTNLVVWRNIPDIIASGPETFLISVSGFTQSVYERSHRDGDIELVKANMRKVAALKHPRTTVQVSWHRYNYNDHEMPLMEALAKELGFNFVPYGTSLIPHDRAMKVWATGIDDPAGEDVLVPVKKTQALCAARKHWGCIIQQQIVAVNGKGNILLCSNLGNAFNELGSFFNKTVEQHLADRYESKYCSKCKSVGGHVYAAQAYTRSLLSPLVWAEQLYRKLGLQGRFPRLTAWATTALYENSRPQEKKTL